MHFVLFGAGSSMGPLASLLKWGATVYCVDIPNKVLWRRLMEVAVNSSGVLVVPVRTLDVSGPLQPSPIVATAAGREQLAEWAGCDLLKYFNLFLFLLFVLTFFLRCLEW
jgi:hypothetical protein